MMNTPAAILLLLGSIQIVTLSAFKINEINLNHQNDRGSHGQYMELKPKNCMLTTPNATAVLLIRDKLKNLTIDSVLFWEESDLGKEAVLLVNIPFQIENAWVKNFTTNAVVWPSGSRSPINLSDDASVMFVVVVNDLTKNELELLPGHANNVNRQQDIVNTALLKLIMQKNSDVVAMTHWRNPISDCHSMHLIRNIDQPTPILRETDQLTEVDASLSICPLQYGRQATDQMWTVTHPSPGSTNACARKALVFEPNHLMSLVYDRFHISYRSVETTNTSTSCDYRLKNVIYSLRFPLTGDNEGLTMRYFRKLSVAKQHAERANRAINHRRRRHNQHRHRRSGKGLPECSTSTTESIRQISCVINEINLNNRPESQREYLEILCAKPTNGGPMFRKSQNFLLVALTQSSENVDVIEASLYIRFPLAVFPYTKRTDFGVPQKYVLISNGTQTRHSNAAVVAPEVDLTGARFVFPPRNIRSPTQSYFPDVEGRPSLIMLLQSTTPTQLDKIFSKLHSRPKIALTEKELNILHMELRQSRTTKVLDAIVYARCRSTAVVPEFARLVPELNTVGHYSARDCDLPGENDFSLSLCSDELLAPFQLRLFRATEKSPAEENLCEKTRVASLPADLSATTCTTPNDNEVLTTTDCTRPMNDAQMELAEARAKRTYVQAFGEYATTSRKFHQWKEFVKGKAETLIDPLKAWQQQKAMHKVNVLELTKFWPEEELNVEGLLHHRCFTKLFTAEVFTNVFEQAQKFELKSWLKIRWPLRDESCSETQLADAALLKIGDEMKLSGRSPLLSTWTTVRMLAFYDDHSFLYNNAAFRRQLLLFLKNHATKSRTRFTALGILAVKAEKLAEDKLLELQKLIDLLMDGQLSAMCRQMKLIYFMAKNGMAMNKYPRMLQFVNVVFEQQLGTAHRTRGSAKKILNHIAQGVHRTLVDMIISDHVLAVSMIIDDTASISGDRKFMAVKVRLLSQFEDVGADNVNCQDVVVSTHFYAMLELKPDKETLRVTSEQHLKALQDQIDKDNGLNNRFKPALRRKLKSVTCDAAHVNIKLVETNMAEFFRKQIPIVLCASHRLQSTIGDAYKDTPWHKNIRQQVKHLYSMFKGNTMHLLEAKAAEKRRKAFPIRNVFDIRWLAHDHRALTSVLKQWSTIYRALTDTNRVVQEKRVKAREYAVALRNRTTLLYMAFEVDVLSVLAPVSMKMQGVNSMAPDVHQMVEDAVKKLDSLKSVELAEYGGSCMKNLVTTSNCDGVTCTSVTQYLTAGQLINNQVQLHKNTALPEFTNDERIALINNMQHHFRDSRFSPTKYPIVNSKIFAASNLANVFLTSSSVSTASQDVDVDAYGSEEVKRLAKMNNLNADNTAVQWNELKTKLRNDNQLLTSSTRVILTTLLTSTEYIPAQHEELRALIIAVLNVEPTSAGAESLFSIYNHVHSKNRKCMTVQVINNELILRTHYEHAEHWQAFESALTWAGQGNRLIRKTYTIRTADGVQEKTVWADDEEEDPDYEPDESTCEESDDDYENYDDYDQDDFDDDFVDMMSRYSCFDYYYKK